MNCKQIKEQIDQLVFEDTNHADQQVANHIKECSSCMTYFDEHKKASKLVGILRTQPVLNKPDDLVNAIMSEIENHQQTQLQTRLKTKKTALNYIRITLAVASVSLLFVFGIEQYVVLDKILKLEQSVSFGNSNPNINMQTAIRFNAGTHNHTLLNLSTKNNEKIKMKSRISLARLTSLSMNMSAQRLVAVHRTNAPINN